MRIIAPCACKKQRTTVEKQIFYNLRDASKSEEKKRQAEIMPLDKLGIRDKIEFRNLVTAVQDRR